MDRRMYRRFLGTLLKPAGGGNYTRAAGSLHAGRSAFSTGGSDSFMAGVAGSYIDEMYAAYLQDAQSVHVSWRVSGDAINARHSHFPF